MSCSVESAEGALGQKLVSRATMQGAARHAAGRPCAFQHGVAELVLALLCAGAAFANAGEAIE